MGPNTLPMTAVPWRCTRNRAIRIMTGNRHHIVCGGIGGHIESFNGREHRDGGGDDAVAVEQRGPGGGQDREDGPFFRVVLQAAAERGQEREGAAFSLVVGTQHKDDVFQADHDDQRPEDHRHDAENIGGVWLQAVFAGEAFLDGVEGTGADITVNYPQGCESQRERFSEDVVLKGLF